MFIEAILLDNESLLFMETTLGDFELSDFITKGRIIEIADYVIKDYEVSVGEYLFTISIESSELINARNNIDELLTEIEGLEWLINNAEVYSPFTGIVSSFSIIDESNIAENQPIMDVMFTDEFALVVQVEEDEYLEIFVGQIGVVELINGDLYDAEVSDKSFYPNNNGTFNVTLNLIEGNFDLMGLSGEALIILERHENVLRVPLSAVKTDREGEYVMIFTGGDISSYPLDEIPSKKHYIEIGLTNSLYAEVISGVEIGEEVITIYTATVEGTGKSIGLRGFGK